MSWNHLLDPLCELAKEAGERILEYTHKDNDTIFVRDKSNSTPLTLADEAANECVVAALKQLTPDWPIISEEEEIPPFEDRQQWETYWLIDPLDGTRGFLDLRAEFTVNIALIHQHRSVLGVIYAPTEQCLYYACEGGGAYKVEEQSPPQRLSAEERTHSSVQKIVIGRYMPDMAWQAHLGRQFPGAEFLTLNSSLKFCWLAEGVVDLYPRAGKISEWDVAAADCLLSEAGGAMVDCSRRPLRYNKSDCILCPPFVAVADAALLAGMQIDTLLNNPGETSSDSNT